MRKNFYPSLFPNSFLSDAIIPMSNGSPFFNFKKVPFYCMNCHTNLVTDWNPKFFLQGSKVCVAVLLTIIWPIIFSGVKPFRKEMFLYMKNFRCLKIHEHKDTDMLKFSTLILLHLVLYISSMPICSDFQIQYLLDTS